jgi:hypothetical protein
MYSKLKSNIFRDIAPYSPVDHLHFEKKKEHSISVVTVRGPATQETSEKQEENKAKHGRKLGSDIGEKGNQG